MRSASPTVHSFTRQCTGKSLITGKSFIQSVEKTWLDDVMGKFESHLGEVFREFSVSISVIIMLTNIVSYIKGGIALPDP